MKQRLYKATRPDGTDFRTGKIDYAAALVTGDVLRHPAARRVKNDPSTYLSVATVPTDCTGMAWPCRLFVVENAGSRMMRATDLPNKRCLLALRVVSELPAHEALGPQGAAVAAIIKQVRTLTDAEIRRLDAAPAVESAAALHAACSAVGSAARDAARYAACSAVGSAAWSVARYAVGSAAWSVAWSAALGTLVRDIIAADQYDILLAPWLSVT